MFLMTYLFLANHQPNQWLVLSPPDSREEANELFAKLAEGGQISSLEEQAAEFYGCLIDLFVSAGM